METKRPTDAEGGCRGFSLVKHPPRKKPTERRLNPEGKVDKVDKVDKVEKVY